MQIKFLPQLDENAIKIWKNYMRSKLYQFFNDVRPYFYFFSKDGTCSHLNWTKWAKPSLGQNKEHQKQFRSGCKLNVYPSYFISEIFWIRIWKNNVRHYFQFLGRNFHISCLGRKKLLKCKWCLTLDLNFKAFLFI